MKNVINTDNGENTGEKCFNREMKNKSYNYILN